MTPRIFQISIAYIGAALRNYKGVCVVSLLDAKLERLTIDETARANSQRSGRYRGIYGPYQRHRAGQAALEKLPERLAVQVRQWLRAKRKA